MRLLLAAAAASSLLSVSLGARAQTSPPAWSSQSGSSGCPSGDGCHGALITSALLGAVPSVTLGVEVGSGSRVRLGTTFRIVMLAAGAASLAAGIWDTHLYRKDGPGEYLPGVLVGGVLGGGSMLGNAIMFALPEPQETQARVTWRPSPVFATDGSGGLWLGAGVSGAMF